MAEYIERDALINILEAKEDAAPLPHKSAYRSALTTVHMLPAADVAPVRHEKWDDTGRYTFPGGSTAVRCSGCGCALTVSEYRLNKWNYCPVCGARMDESGTQPQREDV